MEGEAPTVEEEAGAAHLRERERVRGRRSRSEARLGLGGGRAGAVLLPGLALAGTAVSVSLLLQR